MVSAFKERRDFIVERLNTIQGIKCNVPQGAFYVFPDVSSYFGKSAEGFEIKGSLELADYLLENAKVACVPGIAFGDDRFIRLSYATDKAQIEEGLNRLEEALGKLS